MKIERAWIRLLAAIAVAGWAASIALRLRTVPVEQDDESQFEHLGVA